MCERNLLQDQEAEPLAEDPTPQEMGDSPILDASNENLAPENVNGEGEPPTVYSTVPPMSDEQRIGVWFVYHKPDNAQIKSYGEIREYASMLAQTILLNCPPSADRTAALRKLRECVMTANASIACKGV